MRICKICGKEYPDYVLAGGCCSYECAKEDSDNQVAELTMEIRQAVRKFGACYSSFIEGQCSEKDLKISLKNLERLLQIMPSQVANNLHLESLADDVLGDLLS